MFWIETWSWKRFSRRENSYYFEIFTSQQSTCLFHLVISMWNSCSLFSPASALFPLSTFLRTLFPSLSTSFLSLSIFCLSLSFSYLSPTLLGKREKEVLLYEFFGHNLNFVPTQKVRKREEKNKERREREKREKQWYTVCLFTLPAFVYFEVSEVAKKTRREEKMERERKLNKRESERKNRIREKESLKF